jgi:hypothetical protein
MEAFDKVQPRRAGWREMRLEPGMRLKQSLRLGRLVGGQVVEHEMHVAGLDDRAADTAQKAQELSGPVARPVFAGGKH